LFDYKKYMQAALEQAEKACDEDEVPIGCVICDAEGKIIAETHNLCETSGNPCDHAEMLAIKSAIEKTKDSHNRLEGYSIFVTLEPCPMCAQAISFARFSKLIYGASDPKGGGVENGPIIFESLSCHHKPEIISDVMEEECSKILRKYFKEKR
jgi:tRNA(adenine34) deaminase